MDCGGAQKNNLSSSVANAALVDWLTKLTCPSTLDVIATPGAANVRCADVSDHAVAIPCSSTAPTDTTDAYAPGYFSTGVIEPNTGSPDPMFPTPAKTTMPSDLASSKAFSSPASGVA